MELFGLNERFLEEARLKVKKNKEVKISLQTLKQWLLQAMSI